MRFLLTLPLQLLNNTLSFSFGLVPTQQLSVPSPLNPGSSVEVSLPLAPTGQPQAMQPANLLQLAMKTNSNVVYFAVPVPLHVNLVEDAKLDSTAFGTHVSDPTAQGATFAVQNVSGDVASKLAANNVHIVQSSGTVRP